MSLKTARNFFHFVQSFGQKVKLCDFVKLWVVEYHVQYLDSVTCGVFQFYFYDNVFNPDQNCKIQNKKRLNKNTIETLLNELFVLTDQEQNKATINEYADKHKIVTE